jgi:hypothetical protein
MKNKNIAPRLNTLKGPGSTGHAGQGGQPPTQSYGEPRRSELARR